LIRSDPSIPAILIPMRTEVAEIFRTALLILGAVFPIVNPIGNAPIFLVLTRGASSEDRAVLARKIAMNGFILLVLSVLIGANILAFFGISLPVVQVGGGLVVIATGWSLLNRGDDDDPPPAAPPRVHIDVSRRAFYPLTLPLTVGPGSISVAITVGASRPQNQPEASMLAAVLIGSATVALTIYLSYRFAERIERLLGETAMNVLIRLSSFILLCIGVQILWNGVSALLRSALSNHS
jgi:multiple antibiotic resistance protein